jgi:hypothetical protein
MFNLLKAICWRRRLLKVMKGYRDLLSAAKIVSRGHMTKTKVSWPALSKNQFISTKGVLSQSL